MSGNCAGIVISANGQCGEDAVPLYEAGKTKIECVIAMEALGQLTVSFASFDSAGCTANIKKGGTYGCVTITEESTVKVGVQAQSGQAYIIDQLTHVGKCRT